ncbi:MAG: hypothetical protein OJF60_002422 [Burkholderiaceae bacterium]|nr:MAG: hypothetical protein OJF60_002422 [Burkholderiaceae bacterium]
MHRCSFIRLRRRRAGRGRHWRRCGCRHRGHGRPFRQWDRCAARCQQQRQQQQPAMSARRCGCLVGRRAGSVVHSFVSCGHMPDAGRRIGAGPVRIGCGKVSLDITLGGRARDRLG